MRIWEVKGKDAGDFLHRVTSGPVKPLRVGQGAGGLLLNGQSRMIALFDLLRRDETTFWLATESFDALAVGLEKLHFAEDLSMGPVSSPASVRRAGTGRRETIFPCGESWPSAVPGYELFFGASENPDSYDFDRIGANVPSPQDWTTETPALEAAALPWIDRNKGCYPGQEVVERSLNVGHPARLLVAVEGERAFTAGEKLPLAGGGEGVVTSAAQKGPIGRAMVRVPWAKRAMEGYHLLEAK